MRTLARALAGASLLGALALCDAALAATLSSEADAGADLSRLRLVSSHTEPAPQQSGRYSLRARFQREEREGELREGGDFVLIGRIAKAGASCDANALFRNGFEG